MIYCRVLDPTGRQVVNYRPYARLKRYYRSVNLTAIFGSETTLRADLKHGNGKMEIIASTRVKLLPLRAIGELLIARFEIVNVLSCSTGICLYARCTTITIIMTMARYHRDEVPSCQLLSSVSLRSLIRGLFRSSSLRVCRPSILSETAILSGKSLFQGREGTDVIKWRSAKRSRRRSLTHARESRSRITIIGNVARLFLRIDWFIWSWLAFPSAVPIRRLWLFNRVLEWRDLWYTGDTVQFNWSFVSAFGSILQVSPV